jgi:hypothetical protein
VCCLIYHKDIELVYKCTEEAVAVSSCGMVLLVYIYMYGNGDEASDDDKACGGDLDMTTT